MKLGRTTSFVKQWKLLAKRERQNIDSSKFCTLSFFNQIFIRRYYIESKLLPRVSATDDAIDVYLLTQGSRLRIYIFKLKQKLLDIALLFIQQDCTLFGIKLVANEAHINQIRVTNSLKALKQKKVQFENHIPDVIFKMNVFLRLLYSYKNLWVVSTGCRCLLPWKASLFLCCVPGWHERCYRTCR